MRLYGFASAAFAAAVLFSAAPDEATAATLLGFEADTSCCGFSSRMRLDWSSDFGPDYSVTTAGEVFPTSVDFQPSEIWNYNELHSSDSVSMHLGRQFGSALLSADGSISIGATGPATPTTTHEFHTRLAASDGTGNFYGYSASSTLNGDFFFSGVDAGNPLFWGVEWTLTIVNPAASGGEGRASLVLTGAPSMAVLPTGALGASRTLSGSLFGSQTSDVFRFAADAGFRSNANAAAELIWDLRVAFSGEAFNDIPDAEPVHEPGALALMLLGCAAMFQRRIPRRQAGR